MARVFIHIGAHKTGTSYLQALFHKNREKLAEAGIHYPNIGPNNAHHALAGAWLKMPDIPERFWRKTGGPERMWDDLIATYAKAPGTVFLSAENLSRIHPQRIDYIDLRRRLAAFDEVRVIYTMRAQTALIQSIWMQIARHRRAPEFNAFYNTAIENRRAGGIPIDHFSVYQNLRFAFAPEEIHLMDYSAITKHQGGIAGAFLDLLGAPVRTADLVAPPQESANISPNPLALMAASQINGRMPPPEQLVTALEDIINPTGLRSSLLLERQYTRVCTRFSAGNAALVDAVRTVQPDFDFVQDSPPENMLYRNAMTTRVWTKIASKLYETPALKMQKTNKSTALVERIKRRF